MTYQERLKQIAEIIERVDNRCMAVDGPVTPTLQEMTQAEISEIYELASLTNQSSRPDNAGGQQIHGYGGVLRGWGN